MLISFLSHNISKSNWMQVHLIQRWSTHTVEMQYKSRTHKKSVAKDQPSQGQGQECSRSSTKDTMHKLSQKKRSSCKNCKFQMFSKKKKTKKRSSCRKLQIFREISHEENTKGHKLDPFLTNQKIVLSLAEDRAFSRA